MAGGGGDGGFTGAPGGCTLERVLPGHLFADMAVAVTPDGARIVAGGGEGTIRIWNLATGELERDFDAGDDRHPSVLGSGSIVSLALTPDGRRIVSGGRNGTIGIWDLATGEPEYAFAGHNLYVNSLAVTPDARRIVSAGMDYCVCVWDLATGDHEYDFTGDKPGSRREVLSWGVHAVAITPDGRQVVSGAAQREVSLRVWDLATGALVRELEALEGQTYALAVTPDGRRVVSGGEDFKLRVWDLARGRLERTIEGHTDDVLAVAVTPDSRFVVSGGRDGIMLVSDLVTGRLVHRLEEHTDAVFAVAVTPDGRRLVTGGGDGAVRVWSLG